MKVPSTSLPQQTPRASLVSAEKKSGRILFEQPAFFLAGGREEDCTRDGRRPQEGNTGFSLTSTKLCSFIVTWEVN